MPVEVRRDGHDNNWLLLEFALSIPFAIGLKTEAVSRLLALTLLAEAFTCWNFLLPWPNWCAIQTCCCMGNPPHIQHHD